MRSKIDSADWESGGPDKTDVAGLALGPTGFLRAPALVAGDRMVVGFSEDLYSRLLD